MAEKRNIKRNCKLFCGENGRSGRKSIRTYHWGDFRRISRRNGFLPILFAILTHKEDWSTQTNVIGGTHMKKLKQLLSLLLVVTALTGLMT
ncbi:MAG: hypothetical protein RR295_09800, partial [Oscillospiraceae bacterium]